MDQLKYTLKVTPKPSEILSFVVEHGVEMICPWNKKSTRTTVKTANCMIEMVVTH